MECIAGYKIIFHVALLQESQLMVDCELSIDTKREAIVYVSRHNIQIMNSELLKGNRLITVYIFASKEYVAPVGWFLQCHEQ